MSYVLIPYDTNVIRRSSLCTCCTLIGFSTLLTKCFPTLINEAVAYVVVINTYLPQNGIYRSKKMYLVKLACVYLYRYIGYTAGLFCFYPLPFYCVFFIIIYISKIPYGANPYPFSTAGGQIQKTRLAKIK